MNTNPEANCTSLCRTTTKDIDQVFCYWDGLIHYNSMLLVETLGVTVITSF